MKNKTTLLLLIIGLMGTITSLEAMPAFARKYQMSCKTCHSPFPRLKPYGEEFAGNGFVLKDKDAPRYLTDTGDEKLSLLRDIPLALRIEGFASLNNGNGKSFDMSAPYLIKLLSGGPIAKNISYYFYFFFSERGKVAGLEDAFIMFNNVIGELDVIVGQFQVSDPLFKGELRLPYEGYAIYKSKPGHSGINLTYDRGIMLTYGFSSGTDLTFELLNGSGIGDSEENPHNNFDRDKYKNVMGRISQGIGDHVRFGTFGYFGKEAGLNSLTNSLWMSGGDFTLSLPEWELNLQYVERRDDNPLFITGADEVSTRGGFAEMIYQPKGDDGSWYAVGLFNWIDSDLDELDYTSATLHTGFLMRRNIRLVAEGTRIFKSMQGEYFRFSLGLVTAF